MSQNTESITSELNKVSVGPSKKENLCTICAIDPGDANIGVCFLTFPLPTPEEPRLRYLITDVFKGELRKEAKGGALVSRVKDTVGFFSETIAMYIKKFKDNVPGRMHVVVEQQFSNARNESIATALLSAAAIMGCQIKSASSQQRYRWIQKHFKVNTSGLDKPTRKRIGLKAAQAIEKVFAPSDAQSLFNVPGKVDDMSDAYLIAMKELGSTFINMDEHMKTALSHYKK